MSHAFEELELAFASELGFVCF